MKMTYSDLVKKYVTGGAAIIYLNKKYGEPKYITQKNDGEPKDITKKNTGGSENK
jgi:hypothetical protein